MDCKDSERCVQIKQACLIFFAEPHPIFCKVVKGECK